MMPMMVAAALFVWLVTAVMLAITRVGDESVVLVESLVLFAPLVVVPVGLPLARPLVDDAGASPYALARRLWPLGALGAAAGMVVPEGPLAALFVLPWLFVTSLLASHGLRRLLRGPRTAPELGVSAALLYVPVGAVWLGAYRLGLPLFGFGGVKALLTASHFHYAGFGACLVAGRVFVGEAGRTSRRRVDAPWARQLHRAATLGAIAGIALLAAGITASRPLEIAAAWLLVACVGSIGLLLALRATEPGVDAVTRALLAVSALSTVVSMSFAGAFTMTGFAKLEAVTLHRMATYHGAVNALGFVACGLFGLARLAERQPPDARRDAVTPPRSAPPAPAP